MKKLLSILLFCCSMIFIVSAKAEQALDQIVAIINDDVITRSELDTALTRVKVQISQEHVAAPTGEILQKQVLEQLINKKLQLQIARQMGITIPDAAVNEAIDNVAKQNNTTMTDLYQRLSQENLTVGEYRQEIRDQMILHKIQQQEVAGKINVSATEVATFMKSKTWQSNSEKEYRIEDILIPLNDEPSSDEVVAAKKHALDVLAKLRAGQSFHAIAQSESGGKNALQGGDLGWRKLPEIPSAFTEQVTQLQKNELAGPIQAANGFHLIRLADERSIGNHIKPNQKQVEELLLQQKFEEAVQNWISKLRGQAYIVMNPDKNVRA